VRQARQSFCLHAPGVSATGGTVVASAALLQQTTSAWAAGKPIADHHSPPSRTRLLSSVIVNPSTYSSMKLDEQSKTGHDLPADSDCSRQSQRARS